MLAWQNLASIRRWPTTVPPGLAAVERLDERLEARLPENRPDVREISFYRLTLRSVAAWAGTRAGRRNVMSPDPLYWYAGEWRPDSKIVVWSNNTAIERNLSTEQAVVASRSHVSSIGRMLSRRRSEPPTTPSRLLRSRKPPRCLMRWSPARVRRFRCSTAILRACRRPRTYPILSSIFVLCRRITGCAAH